MTRKMIDYQEDLIESLRDPQEAIAYLNAALMDEDERIFLLALKNVLEAQGGDMTTLAKDANLNRENLYRILSRKDNPKLTSIKSVLNALGFELKSIVSKYCSSTITSIWALLMCVTLSNICDLNGITALGLSLTNPVDKRFDQY